MLIMYTKTQCSFCTRAKQLLESYSINFSEINIESDESLRTYLKNRGLRSVPQFFVNDEHVFNGFGHLSSLTKEEILQIIGEPHVD